jgi:PAS domain S-box-containing protein
MAKHAAPDDTRGEIPGPTAGVLNVHSRPAHDAQPCARSPYPTVTVSRLRWLAILLPAGCVLLVELGLAAFLEPSLGTPATHLVATAILIAGIVAFSLAIFRLIESKERTILELYSRAQRSAERLERLIQSSGDAIITLDLQGRVLSWSRGAEAIYGWSRDEAVGTVLPMVPADLEDDARAIIQRLIERGDTIANYETERLRQDGRRLPVLVTVSPIRNAAGDVVGLLGISKDMSAHRQLEEQARRLALLEDRERIGMELHDGAIQSLYAVGLGLEAVAQVLERGPSLARERLVQARDHVNDIMREIRNYVFDLRPDTFEQHGLVAGIAGLARDIEINTLVDVELDVAEEADRAFTPERTKEIFQVAREAFANVARHASATRLHVLLRPDDEGWILRVADNGVGLDPARAGEAGFGLRNMRERARRLGGALTLSSLAEGGTEVKLVVASDTGAAAA